MKVYTGLTVCLVDGTILHSAKWTTHDCIWFEEDIG